MAKTSLKKWTRVISIVNDIIPTHLLRQIKANSPGVEFKRAIFKFRKRKEILSSFVHFLHKTWNWDVWRRSLAVMEKKFAKKRYARAKLLFCLSNLLLFWSSRCRRRRQILRSLICWSGIFQTYTKNHSIPEAASYIRAECFNVLRSCYKRFSGLSPSRKLDISEYQSDSLVNCLQDRLFGSDVRKT